MVGDSWRVGVLFSRSGVTAAAEIAESNGTLLAIEEINAAGGVLGRPLEPVVHDPGCSADKYRDLALHLMTHDGIRTIFGCYMSTARKSVLPQVEAYRGLLFYPTFYEGFEYSKRCFYTGSSSNQNAVQLARYLIENFGTRIMLVGSNYVFPYEYNRVVTDLVVRAASSVVSELYVPVDPVRKDFNRVIKQIDNLKPDVIVSTVVGTGAIMLYEAYKDAGFDSAVVPIASLTTTEAEVAQMSPDVAAGHLTSASFFETLDSPQAQTFVGAFKRRFGADAPVTASAEAAYFQVHLYARALELAGGDDPDAIAARLPGLEFDAPQGPVRIDPDNHHTELWSRIGRVNDAGKFDIIWSSESRIKPDPYFVTTSFNDWTVSAHRSRLKA